MPVAVVDDRLHELVGDPDRVVRVLVLDRVAVDAVEVHVESGVAQHAGLALLDGLAPDEVVDVGVIGVEDDHLRGTAGLAAGLDGPRRCVGAAHEADRAGGRAAAGEELHRGRGCWDRLTPAPEPPLKMCPLRCTSSGSSHRVVDSEDEAGRCLLRDALHPDVEPHRRVESGLLVDDEVLQLVAEDLLLGLVLEVAVLHPPGGDRVDHPVDRPGAATTPARGVRESPEVLLGEDVRGVHAPRGGDLDAELLEGDRPGAVVGDPRIAALPDDLVVG